MTQVRSVAGLMTPVVAPQKTVGEGDIPLPGEPEAEGPADAVRRAVGCRRERMHESPAAVIAGQLEKHPDSALGEPASLELRQDHPADLGNRLTAIVVVGPQRDRPATTSNAAWPGTIILIHASPAAWTSRATLSSMPSRGSGPPSPAIMIGSHRILSVPVFGTHKVHRDHQIGRAWPSACAHADTRRRAGIFRRFP